MNGILFEKSYNLASSIKDGMAIKYNNVDLLVNDEEDCVEYYVPKTYDSEDELKNKICEIYTIPYRYLTLAFDVAVGDKRIKLMGKFRYL